MSGHLALVQHADHPQRLESRAEIDAWVAERRRALSALIAAEGLGQDAPAELAQTQLEFRVAA